MLDEQTIRDFTRKSFGVNLNYNLKDLFNQNRFSDVTLVSDDQVPFYAHKFVLSACSPVLKDLLIANPHPSPLIYMRGVNNVELKTVLQFMYLGETRIDHDRIDDFLNVVKNLEIKQLFQENMSHNDKYDNLENKGKTTVVQSKE